MHLLDKATCNLQESIIIIVMQVSVLKCVQQTTKASPIIIDFCIIILRRRIKSIQKRFLRLEMYLEITFESQKLFEQQIRLKRVKNMGDIKI